MADDAAVETVDVIITFDPENPKRNETKETLPAAEAYELLNTGRARRVEDEKPAGKKAEKKADTLS